MSGYVGTVYIALYIYIKSLTDTPSAQSVRFKSPGISKVD